MISFQWDRQFELYDVLLPCCYWTVRIILNLTPDGRWRNQHDAIECARMKKVLDKYGTYAPVALPGRYHFNVNTPPRSFWKNQIFAIFYSSCICNFRRSNFCFPVKFFLSLTMRCNVAVKKGPGADPWRGGSYEVRSGGRFNSDALEPNFFNFIGVFRKFKQNSRLVTYLPGEGRSESPT